MPKRGRPSILDAKKQSELCALVKLGCPLTVAAEYVGVSIRVVNYAIRHNPEFGSELKRAQVACELVPLANIREAGRNRWRAAAWFLERTRPVRYGRRKPDGVSVQEGWEYIREAVWKVIHEFEGNLPVKRRIARVFKRWGDELDLSYRVDLQLPGDGYFTKHRKAQPPEAAGADSLGHAPRLDDKTKKGATRRAPGKRR